MTNQDQVNDRGRKNLAPLSRLPLQGRMRAHGFTRGFALGFIISGLSGPAALFETNAESLSCVGTL
jgi:hypothetical protein